MYIVSFNFKEPMMKKKLLDIVRDKIRLKHYQYIKGVMGRADHYEKENYSRFKFT